MADDGINCRKIIRQIRSLLPRLYAGLYFFARIVHSEIAVSSRRFWVYISTFDWHSACNHESPWMNDQGKE